MINRVIFFFLLPPGYDKTNPYEIFLNRNISVRKILPVHAKDQNNGVIGHNCGVLVILIPLILLY